MWGREAVTQERLACFVGWSSHEESSVEQQKDFYNQEHLMPSLGIIGLRYCDIKLSLARNFFNKIFCT